MEFDELLNRVIGCAIEVHRGLGPGLLESAYEQCLAHEMTLNGIAFKLQCPFPAEYKGIHLDCGYKSDFFVEGSLILELNSVEQVLSRPRSAAPHLHEACTGTDGAAH
jgi:GxxExxY protein